VFITLRNVGRYMPEMFVPLIHCVIDYTLFLAMPDFCRMLLQFCCHRHTSLTNFIIQQSLSFEGICIPLRLTNCLFLVPDSQPTATEHFQSPLYGSGTVFHSISHLLCHFPSSALAWSHTSSNSVTRNCSCRARKVTLSFMDTSITLTYLLPFTDVMNLMSVTNVSMHTSNPCQRNTF